MFTIKPYFRRVGFAVLNCCNYIIHSQCAFVKRKMPIMNVFVAYVQIVANFLCKINKKGMKNMFYKTLLNECDKKGVKLTNVFKELGLSSGNMSRWKNGVTPSAVNLKKLSDYFGISVDDLLGNKVHLKDERLESEQDKEIKTKLNSLSEKIRS